MRNPFRKKTLVQKAEEIEDLRIERDMLKQEEANRKLRIEVKDLRLLNSPQYQKLYKPIQKASKSIRKAHKLGFRWKSPEQLLKD